LRLSLLYSLFTKNTEKKLHPNLTLLNDEIIAEMKANRLSSVQVLLYSIDAEIHDSITKLPGSFVKTRDAILKLIENDIPLQISCPTMNQNKDSYVEYLRSLRRRDFPKCLIKMALDWKAKLGGLA
jgi:MoaA/NifB/PqqE/SkfB family radical SAM enzyme